MRVLWITNIPMPEISNHIGLKRNIGGGWMESSAKRIVQSDDNIQLAIACCEGKEFIKQKIGSIVYYVLPAKKSNTRYNKSLEDYKNLYQDMLDTNTDSLEGSHIVIKLKKPYIRKSFDSQKFYKKYSASTKMYKDFIIEKEIEGNVSLILVEE